ncbi:hypothetical protein PRIO_1415 [Paenibacillus riograndensis SBR5]|uniref:Uncharacterized protein n=1 Tax=Paenibacillus riograndensis SBR5 TaxID=1073571 RepID=A0A0E4CV53_9BACL|nr:hypothetical protein PRIO_1415 [Paenibacillus riograndensis SBR5]
MPGKYFNPRSCIRSDDQHTQLTVANVIFQSTLPHKERQRHSASKKFSNDFNPRSHIRSDSDSQPNKGYKYFYYG